MLHRFSVPPRSQSRRRRSLFCLNPRSRFVLGVDQPLPAAHVGHLAGDCGGGKVDGGYKRRDICFDLEFCRCSSALPWHFCQKCTACAERPGGDWSNCPLVTGSGSILRFHLSCPVGVSHHDDQDLSVRAICDQDFVVGARLGAADQRLTVLL